MQHSDVSIDIHEAQEELAQSVERALAGENIVIVREGKPTVRLEPVHQSSNRILGPARGLFNLPDGWEDPMTNADYDEFTNKGAL